MMIKHEFQKFRGKIQLDAKIEIERLKEAKTQVDADKALILEM